MRSFPRPPVDMAKQIALLKRHPAKKGETKRSAEGGVWVKVPRRDFPCPISASSLLDWKGGLSYPDFTGVRVWDSSTWWINIGVQPEAPHSEPSTIPPPPPRQPFFFHRNKDISCTHDSPAPPVSQPFHQAGWSVNRLSDVVCPAGKFSILHP